MRRCALRLSFPTSRKEWLVGFCSLSIITSRPEKQNALADALSRRPDYELVPVTTLSSPITDLILTPYAKDDHCIALLYALGSAEF